MTARARLALAILLLAAPARAIDHGAPPALRDHVVDVYHGVSVADPYRWLENGDDPRTTAWSRAENARARAALDGLPVRAAIAARLKRLYASASPSWKDLRLSGGTLFALVTAPPRQQAMVAVLGPGGDPKAQRIVIDPNAIDPSGQTAIDWWVPSPDGRLIAASLSRNGSEDGTVHVFRTDTGRETGDVVARAQYPTAGGSLAWRPTRRASGSPATRATSAPPRTGTSSSRSISTISAPSRPPTPTSSAATSPGWPRSRSTTASTRTCSSSPSPTGTVADTSTS